MSVQFLSRAGNDYLSPKRWGWQGIKCCQSRSHAKRRPIWLTPLEELIRGQREQPRASAASKKEREQRGLCTALQWVGKGKGWENWMQACALQSCLLLGETAGDPAPSSALAGQASWVPKGPGPATSPVQLTSGEDQSPSWR